MTCRGYFERVKWLAEGTFLNDNIIRAVHQKEILKYELIQLTLPKMPCITQYAILWNRNQKRRKKTKSFIQHCQLLHILPYSKCRLVSTVTSPSKSNDSNQLHKVLRNMHEYIRKRIRSTNLNNKKLIQAYLNLNTNVPTPLEMWTNIWETKSKKSPQISSGFPLILVILS